MQNDVSTDDINNDDIFIIRPEINNNLQARFSGGFTVNPSMSPFNNNAARDYIMEYLLRDKDAGGN